MLYHFIGQCLFGLVVGIIAKFLMPGRDPGGCIVGIGGAALFSWLSRTFLGGYGEGAHWIGAIVGALLILIVYRMVFGEARR